MKVDSKGLRVSSVVWLSSILFILIEGSSLGSAAQKRENPTSSRAINHQAYFK